MIYRLVGAPRMWKKTTCVWAWLAVDTGGQVQLVEVRKRAIIRHTGLPARDLRILDPLLSYLSTVLGRERAIMINLEHIKAIVTAHEVLLRLFRNHRVSNTPDYINISLDCKQSYMLQMCVMLMTANLVTVVTGIFGMNIRIELFDETKAGMPEFLWSIGGGTAGCLILYVLAITWYKHKRLLE